MNARCAAQVRESRPCGEPLPCQFGHDDRVEQYRSDLEKALLDMTRVVETGVRAKVHAEILREKQAELRRLSLLIGGDPNESAALSNWLGGFDAAARIALGGGS